jgi:uncharacterized protein YoxC
MLKPITVYITLFAFSAMNYYLITLLISVDRSITKQIDAMAKTMDAMAKQDDAMEKHMDAMAKQMYAMAKTMDAMAKAEVATSLHIQPMYALMKHMKDQRKDMIDRDSRHDNQASQY